MDIGGIVFVIIMSIAILFVVFFFLRFLMFFRWERGRMDRVYCKRCGQQFDTYATNFEVGPNRQWYEAMGTIHDEKCRCHRLI